MKKKLETKRNILSLFGMRTVVLILTVISLFVLVGCEMESAYLDSIEKKIEEDNLGPEAKIKPAVEITSTSSIYAQLPISITITFSTSVSGFTEGDINVINAEVTNLTTYDDTVYTVDLNNPTGDPVEIIIQVPENVAFNSYNTGNSNGALQINYDTSILSAVITSSESSPTNLDPIPVTVEFSQQVVSFGISDLTCTNCSAANLNTTANPVFTLDLVPSGDGLIQMVIPEDTVESAVNGKLNVEASFSITYDGTAPDPPDVSGTSPTADLTPTWSWESTDDSGNGTFRYKLDNSNLESGTTTTDTSFTPDSNLSETTHTLYVQERDDAGNWSISGSHGIIINTAAPNAPDVSGPDRTTDRTPTWTWSQDTSGGNNSGYFRYRIVGNNWSSETTSTSYTAPMQPDNAEITLIFEVQERSPADVWSGEGSYTTVVDNLGPPAPNVGTSGTTASPTEDATPTWFWAQNTSNDYADTYRYLLNSDDFNNASSETSVNSWTSNTLGEGFHTLFVWQKDTTGNWRESEPGSHTIEVDFLPAGSFTLKDPENGNSSSLAKDWSVTIDSSGISNADEMRFSNDGSSWSTWESKSNSKSWTLTPGDGTKTVYAQYRDDEGNIINESDSISCIPSWDNVGGSEISRWPKNDDELIGGPPLMTYRPLDNSKGFVFHYSDGFPSSPRCSAKVKVTNRSPDGTVITVVVVGYSWGFNGIQYVPSETFTSFVNWDCNPRLYIDLNTGATSTDSSLEGADISIFYSTLYDKEYITSLHGTALDRWNPSP